jgi:CRISPR/Cas system CSM-associated protein Csm3 (group 7 of RAMP superfamily)
MQVNLVWNFLTDWQTASGQEAGTYADQLCIKDESNLPYLPGRSIKGLLRHAFAIGLDNGWFTNAPEDLLNLLFGNEGREGIAMQGILQFSNATLTDAEKAYFAQKPTQATHLFRVLHSTAINVQTGVAENTSLRGIEVAIPMQLQSVVSINQSHPSLDSICDWQQTIPSFIASVLPLIDTAGSKKQRGLGMVEVSMQKGR